MGKLNEDNIWSNQHQKDYINLKHKQSFCKLVFVE